MNEDEVKNIPDTEEEIDTADEIAFEEVNEDGEMDVKATIKKLREKIKKLEQEKKDYLSGWQRANADYANFKKEVETRRKDDIAFASKRLITDLLPTLDAYDMARANKEAWESVSANWRMGIEYIFGQLLRTLENEGVTQYGEEGEVFDPAKHESVENVTTDDESKDNTISQVMQKGYKIGDTIIRVSRVKVFTHNN